MFLHKSLQWKYDRVIAFICLHVLSLKLLNRFQMNFILVFVHQKDVRLLEFGLNFSTWISNLTVGMYFYKNVVSDIITRLLNLYNIYFEQHTKCKYKWFLTDWLTENKKWMCYIDGQNNKYSVLNECNRMLKYNIWRVKKYILASCCTVFFSGFCRLCFRLRVALLCWFSLFH
jgi:hypothetical protein